MAVVTFRISFLSLILRIFISSSLHCVNFSRFTAIASFFQAKPLVCWTCTRPILRQALIVRTSAMPLSSSTPAQPIEKPKLLCLHGKSQNATVFAKKISGARRKMEREFHLDFLDGPIVEYSKSKVSDESSVRAWFLREKTDDSEDVKYKYHGIAAAIQHVKLHMQENGPYAGLVGFSQGGTIAAAIGLKKNLPVLTAGSPFIAEVFGETNNNTEQVLTDNDISSTTTCAEQQQQEQLHQAQQLHLAGETDDWVSADSTLQLAELTGGVLMKHEKGHLFPTRAVYVDAMMTFLRNETSPTIEYCNLASEIVLRACK